jgi:hypothetical protein
MALKLTVPMWTLVGDNEQSLGAGKTLTASNESREYPELGSFSKAIFLLDVSAASGTTPSLTVKVQGFNPAASKWHDVVTFAAQTAATGTVIAPQSSNLDFITYKAVFTITGTTPSFTFTLVAIAHVEEPAVQ